MSSVAHSILAGTLAETDPFWEEHRLHEVLADIRAASARTLADAADPATLAELARHWNIGSGEMYMEGVTSLSPEERLAVARRHAGAALLAEQLMDIEERIAERAAAAEQARADYNAWSASGDDDVSWQAPSGPAMPPPPRNEDWLRDAVRVTDHDHQLALRDAWQGPSDAIAARFGPDAVREGQFGVVAMLASTRHSVEALVRRGADPAILASEYRPEAVLAVARADLDQLRERTGELPIEQMRDCVSRYAHIAPAAEVAEALGVDADAVARLAGARASVPVAEPEGPRL